MLYQPSQDQYPVGADEIMRSAYGKIPKPVNGEFQNMRGQWEVPESIQGWDWSVTFGRWGASVKFKDTGWVWTWPRLENTAPTVEKVWQYAAVAELDLSKFERSCLHMLSNNWTAQGGMCVTDAGFYQAFTRYAPVPPREA